MLLLSTWLRAVLLFYRSILPFMWGTTALIIVGVLVPLLHEGQGSGMLPALVLVKLLTMAVVWYLAEQGRPHQYWLYYNLGISRERLWAGVVGLDGLLFVGVALAVKAWII